MNTWLADGSMGSYSATVPIYNKAYVLGNNMWNANLGITAEADATTALQGMNHTCTSSTVDDRATILANIPANTVFYFATHSDPGNFGDCNFDPNTNRTPLVWADDVGNAVAGKTAAQPPYNVVLILGCQSAGTDPTHGSLADGFGTNSNSIDQAFVGSTTNLVIEQETVNWSDEFLAGLANGKTVSDAETAATMKYPLDQSVGGDKAGNMTYTGDGSTTLHLHAYESTNWYWSTIGM